MKTSIFLAVSACLLVACAHDVADGPIEGDSGIMTVAEAAALDGESAYIEFCAGCHETGMLGAPVAGDAADWGSRSQLWDAVLLDHAITGYLEMPAKGGQVNLPDEVVRSAAEYMLRMSFPDMPHDCNPPYCGDAQK